MRFTLPTLVLLFASGLAASSAAAQAPIPIAVATSRYVDARDTVTIAGRVTVPSGILHRSALHIAIEDGTGGLRVFSRTVRLIAAEGDSVIARGLVRSYRGSLELIASEAHLVPGSPRVQEPIHIAVDPEQAGANSGRLVRVTGRAGNSGRSEGGQWLRIHPLDVPDSSGMTVWVSAAHAVPVDLGGFRAGDVLTVTGLISAYRDNPEDPVVWQVEPRTSADIALRSVPRAWYERAAWAGIAGLALALTIAATMRLAARRQQRALRETEERFSQLLQLSPDAVIVHADGKVLFSNPASATLLGVASGKELIGRAMADFVHPDFRGTAHALHAKAPPASPADHAEPPTRERERFLRADGTAVDVEVAASACRYHDRPAVVVLARDISAQLRHERHLHAMALVDDLTGLYNRRGFAVFAEQELQRARRDGRRAGLVFADLDDLKGINDDHGHNAGDAALRTLARALQSLMDESDVLARWSGDEFVALLVGREGMTPESVGAKLEAVLRDLRAPDTPYRVRATIGTSAIDPEEPGSLHAALDRADEELYRRKRDGKVRV